MQKSVPLSKTSILNALREYRDLEIKKENGSAANNLFYQMREDGKNQWLFVCHVNKMENPDIAHVETINMTIRGNWKPTVYDTLSGKAYPCNAKVSGNKTFIEHKFSQHDSLLLCLEPSGADTDAEGAVKNVYKSEAVMVNNPVAVTLSEPNVLLLEIAEYSFDGGQWQAEEEVLRIDNLFRKKLGYPLRMEA